MLSRRERLDMGNAVGVDDDSAVGSQERRRRKPIGGARQRIAHEISVAAGVELDVVAGSADPLDLAHWQDGKATGLLHGDVAGRRRRAGCGAAEHGGDAVAKGGEAIAREPPVGRCTTVERQHSAASYTRCDGVRLALTTEEPEREDEIEKTS